MNKFVLLEKHSSSFFYIDILDNDLLKKFNQVYKSPKTQKKYFLAILAIANGTSNRKQFNWEKDCYEGKVYALKIDNHRFYTLVIAKQKEKHYYISKYGKKQTQKNDKKLTNIISTVCDVDIVSKKLN